MSMKPIFFNTEMVCAILDGRKTVTRRVLKTDKYIPKDAVFGFSMFTPEGSISFRGHLEDEERRYVEKFAKLPYRLGDILYVRETWKIVDCLDKLSLKFEYQADGKISDFIDFTNRRLRKFLKYLSKKGWCPALFMPKEAARIFLRVTDVSVAKLQDITPADVVYEGAYEDCRDCLNTYSTTGKQCCYRGKDECSQCDSVITTFESLWNSTIKKKDLDLYGWNANPWVWVIEFERISKEEATDIAE